MENTNRITKRSDTADRPEDLSCWKKDERARCLRVECSPDKQFLFPYGYLEQAKFISDKDAEVVELRFKNTHVRITGRSLEPLWTSFQNLSVASIKPLPDRFTPLVKGHARIQTISVETAEVKDGVSEN
jgi:hypothetical protein